ncbi:conserved hypothetical protein [Verticillium alfalfae VaMs.102]|uniref:DUF1917 domain-containing protein n=1 Tax=Verticillium alfalfae (strain VaMs.102 / ATCC MYA-4576 / FGSC 10136) TaxID=526221 RepID=C9SXU4_VERA1|nr:conserved hypothetical protein [Verticillium alfalfae VaMs.102]EEY23609.1 conserved hypothetical protein [Verticillium alfalfae VaMs.102]
MAPQILYDSESDFYGDDDIVAELQARVDDFDVHEWHQAHQDRARLSPMPARKKLKTASKLHNPYAGVPYAWQLTETIDDFLSRLPPATTEASGEVPWIFVCNPYISRKARPDAQSRSSRGNEDEAPEEEGTQLARAVEGGTERLHILTSFLGGLELTAKTKTVKTREANKERKAAVEDVLKLAHACRVRSGKWMLFCDPEVVNEVWGLVAKATANNELGIAAKVAPRSDDTGRKERLICVYTADFRDMADVTRVLRGLQDLGVVETMKKAIYYKPDAFTYIGIAGGNSWGLKASIYNSNEVTAQI